MQNGELSGNGEYKDQQGGGAGLPLLKSEKPDGKKMLNNGKISLILCYFSCFRSFASTSDSNSRRNLPRETPPLD